MKSLGLKVDLEKSSVFVHDIQIPFISKIDSDSDLQQKNGKILLKGVGVQENQFQKSQFKQTSY